LECCQSVSAPSTDKLCPFLSSKVEFVGYKPVRLWKLRIMERVVVMRGNTRVTLFKRNVHLRDHGGPQSSPNEQQLQEQQQQQHGTVAVVYNSPKQEEQYSPVVADLASRARFSIAHAKHTKCSFALFVLFAPTPRIEGQIHAEAIRTCSERAHKVIVVILRHGCSETAVQPMTDAASAMPIQVEDVVEFVQNNGQLLKGRENERNLETLKDLLGTRRSCM
jgi:hypothetical protein